MRVKHVKESVLSRNFGWYRGLFRPNQIILIGIFLWQLPLCSKGNHEVVDSLLLAATGDEVAYIVAAPAM